MDTGAPPIATPPTKIFRVIGVLLVENLDDVFQHDEGHKNQQDCHAARMNIALDL